MKKKALLPLLLACTIVFAACGNNSGTNSGNNENTGNDGNNSVVSGTSEDFRSIQAEKLKGSVNVSRENSSPFGAYEGMNFANGDKVNVDIGSSLLISADSDKHLYAEENTAFSIEASGKNGSTQTHIVLEDGSVLCRLDEKLASSETFEIETESATMAVRGTIFRVSKIIDNNGNKYDMVQVFDGKVLVEIKETKESIMLSEGECCLIRIYSDGDDKFVLDGEIVDSSWRSGDSDDVIISENGSGSNILSIPYEKIPADVIELLIEAAQSGRISVVSEDTLKDVLETGHSYETTTAKEASCTEDGLAVMHCVLCGMDTDKALDALGHEIITDKAIEASCSAPGLTEGSHCERCGEVLTAQEKIKQLEHTLLIENGTPASCLREGRSERITCSVCGEVIQESKVVPRLAHVTVSDAAVEPSCTATGLTEGSHCSVCGTILTAQVTVPASGHTAAVDEAIAPSCLEPGKTEGSHCSVCGTILTAQGTIPALGHTVVIDEAVAPGCSESGKTEGSHCSVCGAIITEQKEIPATGHTIVTDYGYASSCTSGGLTTGSHCSVCGEVITPQYYIIPTGHQFDGKYICKICGYIDEGQ